LDFLTLCSSTTEAVAQLSKHLFNIGVTMQAVIATGSALQGVAELDASLAAVGAVRALRCCQAPRTDTPCRNESHGQPRNPKVLLHSPDVHPPCASRLQLPSRNTSGVHVAGAPARMHEGPIYRRAIEANPTYGQILSLQPTQQRTVGKTTTAIRTLAHAGLHTHLGSYHSHAMDACTPCEAFLALCHSCGRNWECRTASRLEQQKMMG
jgi:hypothetical protein